ncbi:MAG: hypothetical protein KJ614_05495 [Gammaproteobacteria bacterium]|uniref:hypothetical protein n=1 Tax=Rhodoferax sp. TaxID=50421 RepID=UPI001843B06A|nr:hypothetical protein [Rhodoferax sp.]MBU3898372.1 hypothetical protein [Gammaproteobacteria bacterium]MBA3059363.1 hypothetical protein [Rhodoferax sp.]MBU3998091.1 hypothetical protein [Gammaproteobacteria bacterium]MBU4019613.1 hypothetical protein [Gammaproteobacteria bacterium]MBU4079146.1 hypothetical protein [Gammaproteobacteria bacterium]
MKTLFTSAVGALALFTTGVTLAQNGTMMNGSMWGTGWMGGYGGIGMPVLLLVVVVLVVWIIKRGGK